MYGTPMTSGAPWKHILRFAAPVLLGSLLQQLYVLVDSTIVGNYSGQDSLSAVGTTIPFTFLFLAFALGFSAGSGVLVSQAYGARDDERVRAAASTGVVLLAVLGVALTFFGFAVGRVAFKHYVGVPDELLDETLKYFYVYLAGLIFQFGYNIFASNLRAVGDSASTLYFLFIATALNAGLDWLFVAEYKWGVVGAAVATDIAQAASCLAAYLYMTWKYPIFRFSKTDYRWRWDVVKDTLRIGYPIALHLFVISIGTTLIQRGVNSFGKVMMASFTVGRQIELFMNFPSIALQTTLATFTGQNVGARKLDRVKLGTFQTEIVSMSFTIAISLLLWFGAPQIVRFFGLDNEASWYCVRHIRALTLINLVLCSYLPLFGVFQGAGHSGVPALVATLALTLRVSSMYLFGHSDFLGYTICWWNGIFGFSLGFCITWGYYFSGRWKRGVATKQGARKPSEAE